MPYSKIENKRNYQNEWIIKNSEDLTDYYIKGRLRNIGFKNEEITPELIELRRICTKYYRKIKEWNTMSRSRLNINTDDLSDKEVLKLIKSEFPNRNIISVEQYNSLLIKLDEQIMKHFERDKVRKSLMEYAENIRRNLLLFIAESKEKRDRIAVEGRSANVNLLE